MGILYEEGYGVTQDYKKAFEWYSKAAAQNYADAQNNLAALYAQGKGVELNNKKPLSYIAKRLSKEMKKHKITWGRYMLLG